MPRTSEEWSFTAPLVAIDNATFGGRTIFYTYFYQWVTDDVTALAGGGHSGAPLVSTPITIVTTCATASDSIRLPEGQNVGGLRFEIKNEGAENLAIYPAPAHTIEGQSAGNPITLAPGAWTVLISRDATTWMVRE